MNCQVFISNCYSDLGSMDDMLRHCRVVQRLAKFLGETEILRTLEYNVAATKIEKGDYISIIFGRLKTGYILGTRSAREH